MSISDIKHSLNILKILLFFFSLWTVNDLLSSFSWATSSSYDHFFEFPRWSLARTSTVSQELKKVNSNNGLNPRLTLRGTHFQVAQWLNVIRRKHASLSIHFAFPPFPFFAYNVNNASFKKGEFIWVLGGVREHGQHLLEFGWKIRGEQKR